MKAELIHSGGKWSWFVYTVGRALTTPDVMGSGTGIAEGWNAAAQGCATADTDGDTFCLSEIKVKE